MEWGYRSITPGKGKTVGGYSQQIRKESLIPPGYLPVGKKFLGTGDKDKIEKKKEKMLLKEAIGKTSQEKRLLGDRPLLKTVISKQDIGS